MEFKNSIRIYLLIALGGLLLFLPVQTVHLFDWDEINFAEAAREMILTGDYLTVRIDFQQFWEKPPFFIWLQALSFSLFGVGEAAARLPNLLCGIITMMVLYDIGKTLYNKNFGILWVVAYIGSILPQFYFMTGIIDPVYNLFIFLSLYFLFRYIREHKNSSIAISGCFAGFAVITKGPVALVLLGLIFVFILLFLWRSIDRKALKKGTSIVIFLGPLLLISSLFYGTEFIKHGPGFFNEFLDYHLRLLQTSEAGHGQPFYYHFVVLLIGCLPASLLFFGGLPGFAEDTEGQHAFRKLMIIMLLVVLLVFSIVTTKIIHYSSLCYFPISYLAACFIFNIAYRKVKIKRGLIALTLGSTMVIGVLIMMLPLLMKNVELLIPYIADPFAVANLDAEAGWSIMDMIPGCLFVLASLAYLWSYKKYGYQWGFIIMLLCTGLATNLMVKLIVPKIEPITQGAPIEFYKSLQGKDCYVEVLDFKSYAHLFYSGKQQQANENSRSKDWLLEGNIDKPAYFVCKNIHADKYRKHPQLKELYEKNGFVFFERMPG